MGGGPLRPVPLAAVRIDDPFWAPKLRTWRTVTINDVLDKFERDGVLRNFDRVRDGLADEHGGPPWYDGMLYETIRAAADFLLAEPDAALERRVDQAIEHVAAAAARDPDGYINTYTQLVEPDHRWGRGGGNQIWQHDIYNAGALVEAGVHWWRATGKTALLRPAVRLANHMCAVMGPPPRMPIITEHPLPEEALVKLGLLFDEHPGLAGELGIPVRARDYLRLAEHWLDQRGRHEGRECLKAYAQDHKPVTEQTSIEGHAVRATLMCVGLVAVGEALGRPGFLDAAEALWGNMAERRMHITGGVGAYSDDERFGPDYALPNDAYLETCAAVGSAFFSHLLSLARPSARYVDELERVLYNGVLAGVSLTGDTYFYENPLVAGAERRRWSWHGCACCPPMFLKLMSALPGMVYAVSDDALWVNLFVSSQARAQFGDTEVVIRQSTRYPWEAVARLTVEVAAPVELAVNVRLPAWSPDAQVVVGGVAAGRRPDGYASVRRRWTSGDTMTIELPMPVLRVRSHPAVDNNRHRTALQRGPIIYCIEGIDNGGSAWDVALPRASALTARHEDHLLGGITVIEGEALRIALPNTGDELYSSGPTEAPAPTWLRAIPYYANSNREPTDMTVWIPEC